MANDIIGDIKQVRQSNKDANIDVSGIVRKHILVGTDRKVVEDYLKARKFTLNEQPTAADGSQTLVAIYTDKALINVGFHDEIRVIVVFSKNTVKSAGGKLIFRSL